MASRPPMEETPSDAAAPTPIAQLRPDIDHPESRVVDGVVTITWPYSIVTQSIAFILADHDVLLRRNRGQLRVEFRGASGQALAGANLGGGDEVRISLDGARWSECNMAAGLPAGSLQWQLNFTGRLLLKIRKLGSLETECLDISSDAGPEEPSEPSEPSVAAPVPHSTPPLGAVQIDPRPLDATSVPSQPPSNVVSKRLASSVFEADEYPSPAFLKRARVSYGSLFEDGADLFGDDDVKQNKTRQKSRLSMANAVWRYSSRTPSPEAQPQPRSESPRVEDAASQNAIRIPPPAATAPASKLSAMVDEGCQTTQGLPFDASLSVWASREPHFTDSTAHEPPLAANGTRAEQGTGMQTPSRTLFGPLQAPPRESGSMQESPPSSHDMAAHPGHHSFGYELPTVQASGHGVPPTAAASMITSAPILEAPAAPTYPSIGFPEHIYPELDAHHDPNLQFLDIDDTNHMPRTIPHPTPVLSREMNQMNSIASTRHPFTEDPMMVESSPPPEKQFNQEQASSSLDFQAKGAADEEVRSTNVVAREDEEGEGEEEQGSEMEETRSSDRLYSSSYDDGGDLQGEDYDLRNYADTRDDDELESDSEEWSEADESDVEKQAMEPGEEQDEADDEALRYEDPIGEQAPPKGGEEGESYEDEEEQGSTDVDHDESAHGHEQQEEVYEFIASRPSAGMDKELPLSANEEPVCEDQYDEEGYDEGDFDGEDEYDDGEEYEQENQREAPSLPCAPKEPVFISLLSDSEEEDEAGAGAVAAHGDPGEGPIDEDDERAEAGEEEQDGEEEDEESEQEKVGAGERDERDGEGEDGEEEEQEGEDEVEVEEERGEAEEGEEEESEEEEEEEEEVVEDEEEVVKDEEEVVEDEEEEVDEDEDEDESEDGGNQGLDAESLDEKSANEEPFTQDGGIIRRNAQEEQRLASHDERPAAERSETAAHDAGDLVSEQPIADVQGKDHEVNKARSDVDAMETEDEAQCQPAEQAIIARNDVGRDSTVKEIMQHVTTEDEQGVAVASPAPDHGMDEEAESSASASQVQTASAKESFDVDMMDALPAGEGEKLAGASGEETAEAEAQSRPACENDAASDGNRELTARSDTQPFRKARSLDGEHDDETDDETDDDAAAGDQILNELREYQSLIVQDAKDGSEAAGGRAEEQAPEPVEESSQEPDFLITVMSLRSHCQSHRKSRSGDGESPSPQPGDPSLLLAQAHAQAQAQAQASPPAQAAGPSEPPEAVAESVPEPVVERTSPAMLRVARGTKPEQLDPSIPLAKASIETGAKAGEPATPTVRVTRSMTEHSERSDTQRTASPIAIETRASRRLATPETRPPQSQRDERGERDFALQSPSSVCGSFTEDESLAALRRQLTKHVRTKLPDFLCLRSLRTCLNKTADILAVATSTPPQPHRPKHGPRDYMLELTLTDPSSAPSGISVGHVFRPHQASLPVVRMGDVVLLRRVQVVSVKGRGFGVRVTDASAWAVFEQGDEEMLPQIKGPPVEVAAEEVEYAAGLRKWWAALDDKALARIEKATRKLHAGQE
ncbi:uncharacterized protein UV8b_03809 [Ustilaginoidea virens]|uniref:Telomeric single stranded DNA binding POT1/Cdc13 domain-containing protein n=1 Tax=Ustilaginoidea virens TaxID=1159556 RepID=A0A8E5HQK5_USTVR|nr:uncharacterized protein UV8b_03809 [Ustilaginoidea virens]QUC19568.1 hypothetical protein UV8b_03809 [Ustilaginoidea virens]